VESDPTLVGAERGIELHAESSIDLDLTFVINPRHPENNLPFRLADSLYQSVIGVIWVFSNDSPQAFQHFTNRLMEFRLACIAAKNLG
jgi:hypothetical protein